MLTFDEARHEYKLDDQVLPSVTTILAPLVDYSQVPSAVMERARQLGTAVHKTTELFDNDDLDYESMPAELLPYLEAWQRFRVECEFTPTTIEHRLVHPQLGFAGTSDRTGFVRGKKAVIDIKKMLSLGPVIGLQLAAYQAMHNRIGHDITDRYALGLRADGTYRLQAYKDPTDWPTFVSLLTIRNWRIKNGI